MLYVKGCNLDGDYELVDYPSESITSNKVHSRQYSLQNSKSI